jgi:acyl-coenzyme A synthetase/AMP-(fatty) acid ligase
MSQAQHTRRRASLAIRENGRQGTRNQGHHGTYKYPREVHFVDELPKTVSGKIRRTELPGWLLPAG